MKCGVIIFALASGPPASHEVAIRRLAAHASVAAKPVVEVLAKGDLSQRLAALDLLGEWHAPIDQIDPWHPETLTPERLDALRKWAASPTSATKPSMPATR